MPATSVPKKEFQRPFDREGLMPRIPADLNHHPIPVWKRIFDISIASLMIIALSPIWAAIAIYIRLVSGGPVIFSQPRLGEMGEYFTIWKFRTMKSSPDATEKHRDYIAQINDSDEVARKPEFGNRLIPRGKFLRDHALDELPQLINVILGDMSLVGPRPEVLHWEDYSPSQRRRLEATPGMTGLWQVSGKNKLSFSEMVRLDTEYIRDRSMILDCKILFRTIRVVFEKDD